jgi:hypothetical protein
MNQRVDMNLVTTGIAAVLTKPYGLRSRGLPAVIAG